MTTLVLDGIFPNLVHIYWKQNKGRKYNFGYFKFKNAHSQISPKKKPKHENKLAAPILEAQNAFLCISQSLFLFRVRVLF